MKHDKLFATVKGTDCTGKKFEEELEFLLIPPTDEYHYGTGYYMRVKALVTPYRKWNELIDVRYERTTDVEILADRFIEGFYGKNAEEVYKTFPQAKMED